MYQTKKEQKRFYCFVSKTQMHRSHVHFFFDQIIYIIQSNIIKYNIIKYNPLQDYTIQCNTKQ